MWMFNLVLFHQLGSVESVFKDKIRVACFFDDDVRCVDYERSILRTSTLADC